jgi:hypothetical protein
MGVCLDSGWGEPSVGAIRLFERESGESLSYKFTWLVHKIKLYPHI